VDPSPNLLDRAGDPALTALTRVAAFITGAAAAAVHVFDEEHQHRIAGVGAPLGTHPREDAMCRLVVEGGRRIVTSDATADPRFRSSSSVEGPEPVRFYASVPLHALDGTVLGSLCSWDTRERVLGDEQLARLEDLAEQLVARIELGRLALDLGHAASHDPLTGAVNRLVLADRLGQAFARRMRHGGEVLVGVVDVGSFQQISETLGHDAGDEVLVAVARRLLAATRAGDTVARLGGDEFAFVAELGTGVDAGVVVGRIELALAEPFIFAGAVRPLAVTVGAAIAQPGDDVRGALGRAGRAMYSRKVTQRRAAPRAAMY
jgi:diguanylate cyclase (GGDEF)-like protein